MIKVRLRWFGAILRDSGTFVISLLFLSILIRVLYHYKDDEYNYTLI